MSQGLNKTSIIGYLARNPEANDSGTVTRFSVGVTERWRDAEGNEKEHTEWFRVVTFNGTSAACKEFLSRGRRVYVDGRLRSRTYTNREGAEKTVTELVAQNVIFLDGPRADDDRKELRPRPGKPRGAEKSNPRNADGLTADDPPF
jgi:single-strand DNA-binding protein